MIASTAAQQALEQGLAAQARGDLTAAAKAYEQALIGGNTRALVQLAFLCYAEWNDWHRALLLLQRAHPHYPKLAYNLGYVCQHLERWPEAFHYYKKAIKAEVSAAHIQLGYLYECFQDFPQAIMQYQIAVFKGEAQANLLLAQLFESLEDWDRANSYYAAAAQADLTAYHQKLQAHTLPGSQSATRLHAYNQAFQLQLKKGPFAFGQLSERQGAHLQALHWYQQALTEGHEAASEAIERLLNQYSNDQERFLLLKEALAEGVTEAYFHLARFYRDHADYENALMAIKRYNHLMGKKTQKGVDLLNEIFSHL